MTTYFTIFLYVHVFAGIIALISGSLSMFNRKGGKTHGITGQLFFWSMAIVFITSIYMSLVKEKWFLFVTGFFSFYMAVSGYRSLYVKKLHLGQRPVLVDWLIGISGTAFAMGMYYLATTLLPGNSFGIVPIAFGTVSLYFAVDDLLKFYRKTLPKTQWINSHAIRMGGAYTATLTAFLVVNVQFKPSWIIWIAPGIVISVIVSYKVKKFLHPKHKENAITV
jgi:uncharacterized membrane protein